MMNNFSYRRKESKLLIEVKSRLCKMNLMGFDINNKNKFERKSSKCGQFRATGRRASDLLK